MELKYISKKEAKSLIIPSYQRGIKKSIVNAISLSLNESIEWDIPPIMINGKKEVIDGQHRLKAFLQSNATFYIPVVIHKKAEKKDFIIYNNGSKVQLGHKIMIHDIMIEIQKHINQKIVPNSSTRTAMSASDLAKGMYIYISQSVIQANQKKLFSMLESTPINKLIDVANIVISIKDAYFSSLDMGKRFRQQWFLYYCVLSSMGVDILIRMNTTVNRMPNSAGGDISLLENQAAFLDAFNFKLKNKHNISIFKKESK